MYVKKLYLFFYLPSIFSFFIKANDTFNSQCEVATEYGGITTEQSSITPDTLVAEVVADNSSNEGVAQPIIDTDPAQVGFIKYYICVIILLTLNAL